MMLLKPKIKFPLPETEPATDWAYLSTIREAKQYFWLAYSTHRDFLSVPRSYCVLEFVAEQTTMMLQQLDRDDYLTDCFDQLNELTCGIYEWPLESADDLPILIFLTEQQALEITYQHLEMKPEQYFGENAMQTLIQLISSPAPSI